MTATQETAAQTDSEEQSDAAASAGQDNAVQQAAEDVRLAGSDSFWEKSDLEDSTEQQSEAQTEAPGEAAEDAQSTASDTIETDAGADAQSTVSGTVETDAGADAQSTVSGTVETDAGVDAQSTVSGTVETDAEAGVQTADAQGEQDAQEAVAMRHTQAGYVIKEGDTLAAICSRYYGTMDRIADVCEANSIEDANMILPGQRIVLP